MSNISSVLNLNWKCSQVAIIAAQEGWQKASQWTILPWKPSENSNKNSYLRFTAKIFTNMQYFSLFNITFTQRWNVKAACCGLVFIMYWASIIQCWMKDQRSSEVKCQRQRGNENEGGDYGSVKCSSSNSLHILWIFHCWNTAAFHPMLHPWRETKTNKRRQIDSVATYGI